MTDSARMGRVMVTGAGSGLVAEVAAAGGQPLVVGPVAPDGRHIHFEVDLTELLVAFLAEDGLDAVVICDDLPGRATIRGALRQSQGHVVTPERDSEMPGDALRRR